MCWIAQLCPTLCNPMDCSPPGSSLHGNSPGKNTGVGSCSPPGPPPGDLPNPGIKCRSPTLQADSLPAEPPGKPKNTGVGSLSLHQGIFLTQESNWGLLHCRWILYQLSYQGSPNGGIANSYLETNYYYHQKQGSVRLQPIWPLYMLSKHEKNHSFYYLWTSWWIFWGEWWQDYRFIRTR